VLVVTDEMAQNQIAGHNLGGQNSTAAADTANGLPGKSKKRSFIACGLYHNFIIEKSLKG